MNQSAPSCQPPIAMRRLLLRLVLAVLLPLLLVQIGIYAAWYRSRLAEEEKVNLDAARMVAVTFEDYVNDVRRQEAGIGAALAGLHPHTSNQEHNFLLANQLEYPSIHAWHWINSDGKIVASSDRRAVNIDVSDRSYFQKLSAKRVGHSWTISDVLTDRVTGKPIFVVACRIADKDGTLRGIVSATVDVDKLGMHLLATHRGREGFIRVFDSRGVLAYDSAEKIVAHRNWRADHAILDTVLKSGEERSGTLVPQGGERLIAACVPMPKIGWVAGARRSKQEAMSDVHSAVWVVVGLNLLVAIGTGAFAAKTGGTLIGQLRRLQAHAQAIGRGDFGHVAENDGVSELAELAAAFNRMGTAVRAAQESLKIANAHLVAVFDVVNVGMLLVDEHGAVKQVNNTLSRWVGKKLSPSGNELPGEIIGCANAVAGLEKCGETAHCRTCSIRNAIDSVFQTGQPVHCIETEVALSIDGKESRLWLEVSADPVVLDRTRNVILAMSDVTARKYAEDALKHTAKRLKQSNEELEQFAYVASHDLQEPLRVVNGYVQLIDRKYKDRLDADADDFLGYIVDGVARMQQLITDLLNYSRIGNRDEPFCDVRMETILDRVLENLKTTIDESGAVVTHDPLPTVHGDETQLVQLFQNLIGNGIKFRGDRPPRIHVSSRHDGDCWEFSVRDSGIGIDKQYWDQIFVIFQRLHTRQKYPGTGIGLAICKRIVERHGGRIWLDSQPGQGTTFCFTLP